MYRVLLWSYLAAVVWLLDSLLWTGTQGFHPVFASLGIALGVGLGVLPSLHMTRTIEKKGEARATWKRWVLVVLLLVLGIWLIFFAGISFTTLRLGFSAIFWAPPAAWFARSLHIQWWENHHSRKLYSDGAFSTRVTASPAVLARENSLLES